jgi:hypothetical protein
MSESHNCDMSKAVRDQLAQLICSLEKAAKAGVAQRAAELAADFESKLAAKFKASDDRWAAFVQVAEKAVAEANAQIARVGEESGIPEDCRPRLQLGWSNRRVNADASRRAELRRVAKANIEAVSRKALTDIELESVKLQTLLVAGTLQSSPARAFLAGMPTPEKRMPLLSIDDVESQASAKLTYDKKRRR